MGGPSGRGTALHSSVQVAGVCNATDVPTKQFHFATILSPWIRRALVAGGFGYGTLSSRMHEEIAPVTRYHDEYIADPEHADPSKGSQQQVEDPEASPGVGQNSVRSSSEGTVDDFGAPMMLPSTPFFHLDLATAVRAAEGGVTRASSFMETSKD